MEGTTHDPKHTTKSYGLACMAVNRTGSFLNTIIQIIGQRKAKPESTWPESKWACISLDEGKTEGGTP